MHVCSEPDVYSADDYNQHAPPLKIRQYAPLTKTLKQAPATQTGSQLSLNHSRSPDLPSPRSATPPQSGSYQSPNSTLELPTTPRRLSLSSTINTIPHSTQVARDTRLFSLLEHIVSEQKEQRRMLTSISTKLNEAGGIERHEGLEELFPITSQEMLEKLEEKLVEKDFASSVVSFLSVYGGHTIKQTVTRLLRETLSSEVAVGYNFQGKRGKKKFTCLRFNNLLDKRVQRSHRQAGVKEYEHSVKEWLRGAKDRCLGRLNRCNKAQVQEATAPLDIDTN